MSPRKHARIRRARIPRARGYGWLPDLPDHRDILYGTLHPVPTSLPDSIDLRHRCSPVENQGALGSCTAQGLVGALEFLMIKDELPFADLSRLFVYYNERVILHTVKSDSGAMLRDGIKTLVRQGVCTEKKWPYVVSRFAVKPPARCYEEALDHQITSYQRIVSLDEMFSCLAEGFPFVFGFAVYEGFESAAVARTGEATMPAPGERVVGGHAVAAVGYDRSTQRFLCRNSWGTAWGRHGTFTVPFEYLGDRDLSDDFWTIRRGENM